MACLQVGNFALEFYLHIDIQVNLYGCKSRSDKNVLPSLSRRAYQDQMIACLGHLRFKLGDQKINDHEKSEAGQLEDSPLVVQAELRLPVSISIARQNGCTAWRISCEKFVIHLSILKNDLQIRKDQNLKFA